MATAKDFKDGFDKLVSCRKAFEKIPVLLGDEYTSSVVVALVHVPKATKYRDTHIRVEQDLQTLISNLLTYYPFSEEDLATCVEPLVGFTISDLLAKLNIY